MMTRIRLCFVAAALALAPPALADINVTPGSGVVIFDFTCFTTKHCPIAVLTNSAGTEIGTSGAPVRTDPTGTTTQPVSLTSTTITGTVAATQSGTWTVQPGNTANTTPWLVTGSGTAGTAATGVLTVQGIASMTSLLVNPGTAANWGVGATGSAVPANAVAAGFSDGTNTVIPRVGAVANVTVATGMVQALGVAQYNVTPLTVTDTRYQSLQSDVNGFLKVNVTNANANGIKTPTLSSPVVQAGMQYETVAASQTGQSLGATGATGDYLSHCVVYPTTTTPGVVTVFDNTSAAGSNVIAFPGGASSVSNLVPISVPVGAFSTAGAWKVTTGANLVVTCYGNFT